MSYNAAPATSCTYNNQLITHYDITVMACIIQTQAYRSMRDMTLNYIHEILLTGDALSIHEILLTDDISSVHESLLDDSSKIRNHY